MSGHTKFTMQYHRDPMIIDTNTGTTATGLTSLTCACTECDWTYVENGDGTPHNFSHERLLHHLGAELEVTFIDPVDNREREQEIEAMTPEERVELFIELFNSDKTGAQ